MMSDLTKGLLIAGGAALAAGGLVVAVKHASAASTPAAPAVPMATTAQWIQGKNYQFAAPLPAGVTDPTTLASQLTAAGWSNVVVLWPWAPTGQTPAVPPALAAAMAAQGAQASSGAYIAQGLYTGATTPIPAGVVSIATS
jgi:hypothetical protein